MTPEPIQLLDWTNIIIMCVAALCVVYIARAFKDDDIYEIVRKPGDD